MNKYQSVYNNELIGLISIISVLKHHKKMSLGKVLLILPFFSHGDTLNLLKSKRVKIRSLEEFIVKYPSGFSSFNDRYYSLLTTSINSIILLKRMQLIIITKGQISVKEDFNFELENKSLGNRAKDIVQASQKLSEILMESTFNLYLQLRVKI
ncbi:three component ABC system middle component [Bacillus velezensis]